MRAKHHVSLLSLLLIVLILSYYIQDESSHRYLFHGLSNSSTDKIVATTALPPTAVGGSSCFYKAYGSDFSCSSADVESWDTARRIRHDHPIGGDGIHAHRRLPVPTRRPDALPAVPREVLEKVLTPLSMAAAKFMGAVVKGDAVQQVGENGSGHAARTIRFPFTQEEVIASLLFNKPLPARVAPRTAIKFRNAVGYAHVVSALDVLSIPDIFGMLEDGSNSSGTSIGEALKGSTGNHSIANKRKSYKSLEEAAADLVEAHPVLVDDGVSQTPLERLAIYMNELHANTTEARRNEERVLHNQSSDQGNKGSGEQAAEYPFLSQERVREYFSKTMVLVMLSPPRYHLVNVLHAHWSQFFSYIYYVGPRSNYRFGIPINGHEILFGNEQYRATNEVLRLFMNYPSLVKRYATPHGGAKPGEAPYVEVEEGNATDALADGLTGLLFLTDDMIFQPWAIATRNLSLSIPWCVQMGIGSLWSSRVDPVPGMAIVRRERQPDWVYWRKNRPKVRRAFFNPGGIWGSASQSMPTALTPIAAFRQRIAAAARATSPWIYAKSRLKRRHHGATPAARRLSETSMAFYAVADSYYIPRSLWADFCHTADLFAGHFVHQEIAVPTVLRSLFPSYNEINVQFYWRSSNPADCLRHLWNLAVDGTHRCRHDHAFPALLYDKGDLGRAQLLTIDGRAAALKAHGLIPAMFEPLPENETRR